MVENKVNKVTRQGNSKVTNIIQSTSSKTGWAHQRQNEQYNHQ